MEPLRLKIVDLMYVHLTAYANGLRLREGPLGLVVDFKCLHRITLVSWHDHEDSWYQLTWPAILSAQPARNASLAS